MVNLLFIEDDDVLSKPGVVRSLYGGSGPSPDEKPPRINPRQASRTARGARQRLKTRRVAEDGALQRLARPLREVSRALLQRAVVDEHDDRLYVAPGPDAEHLSRGARAASLSASECARQSPGNARRPASARPGGRVVEIERRIVS